MVLQEVQLTLGYQLPVKTRMIKVYIYVVDRDFGFAPNPFHGFCTLATCKPGIRKMARIGDWIIGMGGGNLKATGRCVFAMRVSEIVTYNEYWINPIYLDKKPVRNGSSRMMVGDNIYYLNPKSQKWHQADSHHSNADGSINPINLHTDTKSDKVIISRYFYYFGSKAPVVPNQLLTNIGYENGRNYRVFDLDDCVGLVNWIEKSFYKSLNKVMADPFDFDRSEKRYSGEGSKIT
jgi:hypothetical protein